MRRLRASSVVRSAAVGRRWPPAPGGEPPEWLALVARHSAAQCENLSHSYLLKMRTSYLAAVSQRCRHDRRFQVVTKQSAARHDCPRTWSVLSARHHCARLLAMPVVGRLPPDGDETARDGGATTLLNDDGNDAGALIIAIANYARLRLQRAARQLSKSTVPVIMLIDVP